MHLSFQSSLKPALITIVGRVRRIFRRKLVFIPLVVLVSALVIMYGLSCWYRYSESRRPLVLGTSFVPAYAESLGLDPRQTMDALLNDLGVKHLRLVSYWSQLEPEQGKYDFSLLDWQFAKAEQAHATVSLSVGLRQPRWPECHMPDWAANEPASVWQPQLEQFMTAIVQRYKHSPALQSYQVENEYFLKGFGTCTNFDRNRLIGEYDLVHKLDPGHTLIGARSNNILGWPVGKPAPDEYGVSVYKRVWDAQFTHRYVEYPYPAWYYGFMAGFQKLFLGRDMIIHELQAEAWPPNHQSIQETSLAEQNKSFDAARFKTRLQYGQNTGIREIYLWGSEYWYYRKIVLHDDSLWQVARGAFDDSSNL